MAGEITMIAGTVADAQSSPIAASSRSSGHSHSVERTAADRKAIQEKDGAEGLPDSYPEEEALLNSILEQARNVMLSNNTTLSFERDDADGKMYISIRDKSTGEEVCRIPRKWLADIDLQLWQRHKVDVHI